jgi:hypothetical protein
MSQLSENSNSDRGSRITRIPLNAIWTTYLGLWDYIILKAISVSLLCNIVFSNLILALNRDETYVCNKYS